MVSAVVAKIVAMQQSLTVSENEIAQYVINNADAVVTSTITAIAKNTGTSEASINRFCKKIGFKGFNSFKIALAQENFYNSMKDLSEPGAREGFVSTVSRDYRHVLANTTAMLDEDMVIAAADALRTAEHIFIFALSYTSYVARELEFKLSMVGLHAKAVVDIGDIRICANNLTEDDLVVVIAPTLMMRDLYHAIVACKDKGATLLSITSYDNPKLNSLVDYKFIISDKITTRNSVSISNNLMFLFVTDVLYCGLLERDKTLKQRRLSNDAILNTAQSTDNYFFEF
ncbi:MAG TPA: MurR/RpiR family transcriptional regulator [Pseudoflavonifractor sp.]|nr:MurR/RpiR family transcriptional regulator [Pseudoflavonifractor sp.]